MTRKHLTRIVGFAFLSLTLTGCATTFCGFPQDELEESFIPLPAYTHRPPVDCEHVVFMEAVPTDRKFVEIGIIAPRDVKSHSWANAVHAARAAAALRGADAILILSEKEMQTWGFQFNSYGGGGGKHNYVQLRCKAIVWTDSQ